MCICFDTSGLFFNNNIIDDSHLYKLISTFCSNILNSYIDLENEYLFLEIIEELTINHSSSTRSLKKIGREKKTVKILQEYIEDNYKDNISCNQLSKISGLSIYYLIRLFSNEYDFSPHGYQNYIRIKRVKQLLMNEKMTMADIALDVGFVDQSHMVKHFKKSVGITPNRYFQEMRK